MSTPRLALADDFSSAADTLATMLRTGGVAVFPTETVYGVGVMAGAADALSRLRRLKGRDDGKPFQILISGPDMAAGAGAVFSHGAGRLARRFWPGPLTLVVPTATGDDVGLRVPDSAFMLAVLARLERGIVASSANAAGQPPPQDADAAAAFAAGADLLVDGGPCAIGAPSSVVRCVGDACDVLREGALSRAEILAVFHEAR